MGSTLSISSHEELGRVDSFFFTPHSSIAIKDSIPMEFRRSRVLPVAKCAMQKVKPMQRKIAFCLAKPAVCRTFAPQTISSIHKL